MSATDEIQDPSPSLLSSVMTGLGVTSVLVTVPCVERGDELYCGLEILLCSKA